MDAEVHDKEDSKFDGVLYSKIFNPKVVDFLSDFDFRGQLTEYITKYNSLLEASTFFKRECLIIITQQLLQKILKITVF
ncbi:MAG: hypothetical protein ACLSGF_06840 [Alistipes onderdonkii]